MWIDTDDGVVNLDSAERIAIVDGTSIHIFRSGGGLLAAQQFPSADDAEAAYKKIRSTLGIQGATEMRFLLARAAAL